VADKIRTPEGNVDQIRDILFGGQMRDYERRFQELEERSRKELDKLRSEVVKRLEQIDSLIHDNQERSGQQFKKLEQDLRASSAQSDERLNSAQKQLKQDLSSIDDKHDKAAQTLRERLHKLASESQDSLRARAEELAADMQRQFAQLHDQKTARDELAGLLTEMAMRLNRQFELPIAAAKAPTSTA
jgi:DNA repair exonuclease SbcCD ATPase subunit